MSLVNVFQRPFLLKVIRFRFMCYLEIYL